MLLVLQEKQSFCDLLSIPVQHDTVLQEELTADDKQQDDTGYDRRNRERSVR